MKTGDDRLAEFSHEVVNTIQKNFYVDDCLKAVNNTEQVLLLSFKQMD